MFNYITSVFFVNINFIIGEHYTLNGYKSSGKFLKGKREGPHEFKIPNESLVLIREYKEGKLVKLQEQQVSLRKQHQ